MTAHCDTCGQPVIRRADGKTLAAEPSTLGIHLPDAGTLTTAEFRKGYNAGTPRGHIAHICDPNEQQALFELVGMPTGAKPARRKR